MVLAITPSQESFILNLLDEQILADETNTTIMAEAMVKDHNFSQMLPILSHTIVSHGKDSRQEKTVDFHIPTTKRQKPSPPEFDIKAVVSGRYIYEIKNDII